MEQIKQLQNVVHNVEDANRLIVDNISNVSAVTQEITAEANSTLESCELNEKAIKNVGILIEQLNQNAEELKQK